jgi:hypothetical protein
MTTLSPRQNERTDAERRPSADYMPQGTCPKPWVARVDGKALRDGRGGVRRYGSEKAALAAAKKAASEAPAKGGN